MRSGRVVVDGTTVTASTSSKSPGGSHVLSSLDMQHCTRLTSADTTDPAKTIFRTSPPASVLAQAGGTIAREGIAGLITKKHSSAPGPRSVEQVHLSWSPQTT